MAAGAVGPPSSSLRYRIRSGNCASTSSQLLATPSGIQKWPPASTPSRSGMPPSAPIIPFVFGKIQGAPSRSTPPQIVQYQCGMQGPRMSSRVAWSPHESIFATTLTAMWSWTSVVVAPDGLTAAGCSAQLSRPGSGLNSMRR